MEFVQIRKRHFFSIGEKQAMKKVFGNGSVIRSSACSQKGLYIIHAQSLSEIGLFLAFQHNYFTAIEVQHFFWTIGAVLIGQSIFFTGYSSLMETASRPKLAATRTRCDFVSRRICHNCFTVLICRNCFAVSKYLFVFWSLADGSQFADSNLIRNPDPFLLKPDVFISL